MFRLLMPAAPAGFCGRSGDDCTSADCRTGGTGFSPLRRPRLAPAPGCYVSWHSVSAASLSVKPLLAKSASRAGPVPPRLKNRPVASSAGASGERRAGRPTIAELAPGELLIVMICWVYANGEQPARHDATVTARSGHADRSATARLVAPSRASVITGMPDGASGERRHNSR